MALLPLAPSHFVVSLGGMAPARVYTHALKSLENFWLFAGESWETPGVGSPPSAAPAARPAPLPWGATALASHALPTRARFCQSSAG